MGLPRVFGVGHLLPCTADGIAVFIKEVPNLTNQHDITALIIAAIAPAFDGAQLWKFLLPIAQNVWFYGTQLTHFTNGEITFAWDYR